MKNERTPSEWPLVSDPEEGAAGAFALSFPSVLCPLELGTALLVWLPSLSPLIKGESTSEGPEGEEPAPVRVGLFTVTNSESFRFLKDPAESLISERGHGAFGWASPKG